MRRARLAAGIAAASLVASACGAGAPAGAPRTTTAAPSLPTPVTSVTLPAPASPSPEPLPAPNEPVPRDPGAIAQALRETTASVHRAIDRWLAEDPEAMGRPPRDVVLLSLYLQRITRRLAQRPELAETVLARLDGELAKTTRANVAAAAKLFSIVTPISGASGFLTRAPPPAGELLGYFREAERRFGVDWEILAAVCYVESKFARVTSASTAGAQGPMQFIPSTWEAYGMGGDVHDPHDAIMGAANYLRASGAPHDYRSALYAYNHSEAYVDAILAYAGRMTANPRLYFVYYNWQVFVLTTSGDRRLTGPGLD